MKKHNLSSLYLAICALCTMAIVWIYGFNAHGLFHMNLWEYHNRARLMDFVYLGIYALIMVFLLLVHTVSSKLFFLYKRHENNGPCGKWHPVIYALWVIVGVHIFARLFIGMAILREMYPLARI